MRRPILLVMPPEQSDVGLHGYGHAFQAMIYLLNEALSRTGLFKAEFPQQF